jgi:hypothetical protein
LALGMLHGCADTPWAWRKGDAALLDQQVATLVDFKVPS